MHRRGTGLEQLQATSYATGQQASGRRSPASTEVHLCVPVGGRESAGVCSGAGGNGVGSPCACTRALEAQLMWNDWNDTGGVLRRCGTTEPIQCPDGANTTPDARGMPRHRKNRLQCKVPWGEGAAHAKEKSQARPGKEATGAEETVGCQHGATRSGVRANVTGLNRSARQAFDSTVTRLSRGGGDDDE